MKKYLIAVCVAVLMTGCCTKSALDNPNQTTGEYKNCILTEAYEYVFNGFETPEAKPAKRKRRKKSNVRTKK